MITLRACAETEKGKIFINYFLGERYYEVVYTDGTYQGFYSWVDALLAINSNYIPEPKER